MEDGPFIRQPRATAVPEPEHFPELLDDSQWTQAATFSQDENYSGPSDRIGRYYRQSLSELDSEALERKRAERTTPSSPLRPTIEKKGWAAGLACRPLLLGGAPEPEDGSSMANSALGILQRQRTEASRAASAPHEGTKRSAHITDPVAIEQRMATYVRDGIDHACLAPFNDAWMESAMEQVPTELNGVDTDQVEVMLDDMVQEVHDDYFEAVKLSMVDYVLRSQAEGVRLEITKPTAKFELVSFHPSQVRWYDGRMVRWYGAQMVRWSDGTVVRWSDGQMMDMRPARTQGLPSSLLPF